MAIDDELRAYLLESLDVHVRSGYGGEDDILESFEEQVRDELRDHPQAEIDAAVTRWLADMQRAIDEQRAREKTWTGRTHNDRIDTAFRRLTSRRIVALQDAGYTMSDGWSDVHEARGEVDGAWGAVFFHRQDVERGVHDEGLMLAFGAFVDGDRHEPESLRLARTVCEVLEAQRVATEWDGTLNSRISIPPFEWKKRRWTTPGRTAG
ncbi:MAG: hypothetical protein K0V04_45565 [Deltaproteobacteria bacterium]|nr:hypothetical protein [Deltaproteobacteria bacterium]